MERAERSGLGWGARLLIAFTLILAGAAAATWGLARYEPAARLFGVAATDPPPRSARPMTAQPPGAAQVAPTTLNPAIAQQIADLQVRIRRVESESEEAQGSAGRADALLIAFAARRALERGVALGYLEPLLVDRFGTSHPKAVSTIVTASRSPVRLTALITRYQELRRELLGPSPDEDLWTRIRRGFSSLISIRRSDRPATEPKARYERALSYLTAGEVDSALAETMRLPGAARASEWIADARRYVAARRALDTIESAALIGTPEAG